MEQYPPLDSEQDRITLPVINLELDAIRRLRSKPPQPVGEDERVSKNHEMIGGNTLEFLPFLQRSLDTLPLFVGIGMSEDKNIMVDWDEPLTEVNDQAPHIIIAVLEKVQKAIADFLEDVYENMKVLADVDNCASGLFFQYNPEFVNDLQLIDALIESLKHRCEDLSDARVERGKDDYMLKFLLQAYADDIVPRSVSRTRNRIVMIIDAIDKLQRKADQTETQHQKSSDINTFKLHDVLKMASQLKAVLPELMKPNKIPVVCHELL